MIIGASSVAHIEQVSHNMWSFERLPSPTYYISFQNLVDLEKGPLPESMVQALDEAWDVVKGHVKDYWHRG